MSSYIHFHTNQPFGESVLLKDLPLEYDCVQLYGVNRNKSGSTMLPIGTVKLSHQIYMHDLEKLYAEGWTDFVVYPMSASLRGRIPDAMFKADGNG